MTDEIELRKYCVERAISAFTARGEPSSVAFAREIYDFLKGNEWAATEVVKGPEETHAPADLTSGSAWSVDSLHMRPFKLKPLTPVQKAALKAAIDLWRDNGRVNGSEVARALNWDTPGNINAVFKVLCGMGYCRRQGWFITPLFTPDGVAVGPVIRKLPDGVAKGYKPMTAKLGEVGRIS